MSQCEEWIADIQQYSSDKRVGRTMSHHAAALKRHTAQLREELLKLPCPDGLEPDGDNFPERSMGLKELPGPPRCREAGGQPGQRGPAMSPHPPHPFPASRPPLLPPHDDYYSPKDLMASEHKPPLCQYLYVKI
ncbi:hypothetical protein CgunFtcFv8_016069 [Champsocephalus gunnari]|uniref:Uncharacterized protein n=1 Tax=Champsocephalus gunnari TaxID=52237 RepID=A0AAN8HAF8_CHAGU|nr:hypothetical protein CgunFtcFv8_016069 [Champsocephalus gunnari]